ncbi:serrate RNA effector molecule-like isoform X3 [Gossypium australe]|uniref:Serrate RNA effector molecule-like isoform X3 n=1 Tax=Gossypium australe TaxID=47621 RepID=A0A5B6VIF1_9ROSI|nr:serrate RNA effector molecule-like isoform X3 [Gossypium australe]
MPVDSLDRRRGGDRKDNNNNNSKELPPSDDPNSSPPAPPPPRRRDRDSRERRDRDYYDRNRSPPPPPTRERDYKRRSSISPPPPPLNYRDRRHSPPPRRSPPYKRSRREDGGYEGRRGSPRGGFGPGDRRRIQIDIGQAQGLVRKLDSEKGIEENILSGSDNDKISRDKSLGSFSGPVIIVRGLTSVKGLEGVELLDTLITYLWRVHGVDYYGMIETSEAKGFRHVRAEGKSADITSNGSEWERKLDSYWQDRLRGQDPLEVMTAKDKLDAAAVESLDPFVRKIRDEKYGWKYGCGAKGCTKLFHAAEFVHKHLKLKHPELVVELTSKVREELYFQNYMNDPDAPGGTPVMQQPIPKDRPQRRKIMENRLKDERGLRREHLIDLRTLNQVIFRPTMMVLMGGIMMILCLTLLVDKGCMLQLHFLQILHLHQY